MDRPYCKTAVFPRCDETPQHCEVFVHRGEYYNRTNIVMSCSTPCLHWYLIAERKNVVWTAVTKKLSQAEHDKHVFSFYSFCFIKQLAIERFIFEQIQWIFNGQFSLCTLQNAPCRLTKDALRGGVRNSAIQKTLA